MLLESIKTYALLPTEGINIVQLAFNKAVTGLVWNGFVFFNHLKKVFKNRHI